jgi:hypothetical protein
MKYNKSSPVKYLLLELRLIDFNVAREMTWGDL